MGSLHDSIQFQNRGYLLDNFSLGSDSSVIQALYSARILTDQEYQSVRRDGLTEQHRIITLLEILKTKNENQLEVFVETLEKTGHNHLAEVLRLKEGGWESSPKDRSWWSTCEKTRSLSAERDSNLDACRSRDSSPGGQGHPIPEDGRQTGVLSTGSGTCTPQTATIVRERHRKLQPLARQDKLKVDHKVRGRGLFVLKH
jgi:hypothetical protein